jgi:phage/plasmid-like protein (TIGR03299 family)
MAHELDFSTGKAACFVTGKAAWHRLGVRVDAAQTSDQAIRLARLDWSVEKRNMAAAIPGGGWSPVEGSYAVVRSDTQTALGVVGEFYHPLQNAAAFDFMDSIVGDRLAMFETAGALKGGRRVWMLARLPREIRAAGDDVIHPYVLLTNSHDGTSAVRIIPTTVRVVCQNTLNLALRGVKASEGLSIVHTASLTNRVAEARRKFGIVLDRVDRFELESQALARRSLSTAELATYFSGLVDSRAEKGQKKLLEQFFENLNNPRNTLKGIEGSAWAAYNAVSEWSDHQVAVRGGNSMERDDARLSSIWFGTAARMKERAFQAALAIAS